MALALGFKKTGHALASEMSSTLMPEISIFTLTSN